MKKLKWFNFRDIDSHYVIRIFDIQISLKHKCRFKYKKADAYGISAQRRVPQIIVSLTSHPARIDTVHLAINTLLRQTLKPDRIILWLAKEQFPQGENSLPDSLTELQALGLDIKWCEDLKSYKKLVPALREFPEDMIVTVDDDLYYEENMLEMLYKTHLEHPQDIVVNRSWRVKVQGEKLIPLASRKISYEEYTDPSYLNQLMGGSGCLYPPNSLHKDVLNTDKIMSLIPTHDDVYFWVMAVINGTRVRVANNGKTQLYYIENTQKSGLCKINRKNNAGMPVTDAYTIMLKEYPRIMDKFREDLNAVENI